MSFLFFIFFIDMEVKDVGTHEVLPESIVIFRRMILEL
jgi:hypothetical protein